MLDRNASTSASRKRRPGQKVRSGFILMAVAGMLAVLVVLGLSFADQSRADLMGAANSRDLAGVDALAEGGFAIAERFLADSSVANPKFTSRWGYNGSVTPPVSRDKASFLDTWQMLTWYDPCLPAGVTAADYNSSLTYRFQFDLNDSSPRSRVLQRFPLDDAMLQDTWALQPLCRVRRYLLKTGNAYGTVQISIVPTDGAYNVNDVFESGAATEGALVGGIKKGAGVHDSLRVPPDTGAPPGVTAAQIDWYASPDRRTLEYMMGRRPEYATLNREVPMVLTSGFVPATGTDGKPYEDGSVSTGNYNFAKAQMLNGDWYKDDGVYNFHKYFEPRGWFDPDSGLAEDNIPLGQWAFRGRGYLTKLPKSGNCPAVFYNADPRRPYRYNYEGARYPMWAPAMGMALRYDKNNYGDLSNPEAWWNWNQPGRFNVNPTDGTTSIAWVASPYPYPPQTFYANLGDLDSCFWGFGFDAFNPKRGGISADNTFSPPITTAAFATVVATAGLATPSPDDRLKYIGAGLYGHPKPHTLQMDPVNVVFNRRFLTDVMAAFSFGGAPGYSAAQGRANASELLLTHMQKLNCWAGSAYSTMGLGTHWMPPTMMVWATNSLELVYGNKAFEVQGGMTRMTGNMPACKAAATYVYPLTRLACKDNDDTASSYTGNDKGDDYALAAAHFTFRDVRSGGIRASGIQLNYGQYGKDDPNGRFYDAPNINVTSYPNVYGLFTPEKIPSMLDRTVVAPHLHWKARWLDGAYKNYDNFLRYNPYPDEVPSDPTAAHYPVPYADTDDGCAFGILASPELSASAVTEYKDAPKQIGPSRWNRSIHRHYEPKIAPSGAAPVNPTTVLGKMDFYTGRPVIYYLSNLDFRVDPNSAAVTDANQKGWKLPLPAGWTYNAPDHSMKFASTTGVLEHISPPTGAVPDGKTTYYIAFFADVDAGADAVLKVTFGGVTTTISPLTAGKKKTYTMKLDGFPTSGDLKLEVTAGNGKISNIVLYSKGAPMDDVFTGCQTDLTLSPPHGDVSNASDTLDQSVQMPRVYERSNWPDLFMQNPSYTPYVEQVVAALRDPTDNIWNYRMGWISPFSNQIGGEWSRGKSPVWSLLQGGVFTSIFLPPQPYSSMGTDVNVLDANKYSYYRFFKSVPNWANHQPKPHPVHGFPNPNYLLLEPGQVNLHWSDQFRRYEPIYLGSPVQGGLTKDRVAPCAPLADARQVICHASYDRAAVNTNASSKNEVYPDRPVASTADIPEDGRPDTSGAGFPRTPPLTDPSFVPAIGKDEAWRITRVGRKYQEILADEIMDYQINPYWPNPCVHFDANGRIAAKSLASYLTPAVSPTRCQDITAPANGPIGKVDKTAGLKLLKEVGWWSYYDRCDVNDQEFKDTMHLQVPDYYAYFNRFWVRVAGRYDDFYAQSSSMQRGQPYCAEGDILDAVNKPNQDAENPACTGVSNTYVKVRNAVENAGIYPPAYQYFGVNPGGECYKTLGYPAAGGDYGRVLIKTAAGDDAAGYGPRWKDRIFQFPYNTLEDQSGCEWRYTSAASQRMMYPNLNNAPLCNHPFKNWADFVGMLGHLVYRSPLPVRVESDWSKHASGDHDLFPKHTRSDSACCYDEHIAGKTATGVDAKLVCVQAGLGGGKFFDGSAITDADSLQSGIVADAGYWPISANYGNYYDLGSNGPKLHPGFVGPWTTQAEWDRRLDEWRGRDASGLRVEHQYISEAAANDVLVSLSNGRIPPLDFDGDGHVTMTLKADLDRIYNPDSFSGRPGVAGAPSVASTPVFWDGFPYHNNGSGLNNLGQKVERQNMPGLPLMKDSTGAAVPGTNTDRGVTLPVPNVNPSYSSQSLNYGLKDDPRAGMPSTHADYSKTWTTVEGGQYINGCVTLPIKFRSDTFRVSLLVTLTDSRYKKVLATRKFSRTYSRLPVADGPGGTRTPLSPYVTGGMANPEFIIHEDRIIQGSDPQQMLFPMK